MKKPTLRALAGEDRAMSIDEFIAFSTSLLASLQRSVPELQSTLLSAKDAYLTKHGYSQKSTSSGEEATELNSIVIPLTRDVIREHFTLDEKTIRTYNEKKEKEETREAKRKELENEMGVLKWDMEQIYEEIKEEKKANGPDSKEVIAELNGQIADMNKRMKEIRNELYYL